MGYKIVILGLWFAIAIAIYIEKDKKHIILIPSPELKTYEIQKVIVVSGDTFDLSLRDGRRILAKLSVSTVDSAKGKVVDILNHCTNPRVILLEKQPDGSWKVDFFFTHEDKEINLSSWLVANKLVYE